MAEIQGLYGPFSFPEKLLQMIWLRGDFDPVPAATTDGRRLRIVYAGKWNRLGGPDFQDARLRFGEPPGAEVRGDVEVHLHAPDWDNHAHARDPGYDRVILHVVLFSPPPGHVTRGWDGREIPVLVLLPLLHRGLEEFAADEAVENLARRPLAQLPGELGRLSAADVVDLLRRHAEERWRSKVHFARLRVQKLGWAGACHHAALEILGFRFNRAPMLRIAGRWPLAEWISGCVRPDDAYAAEADAWSLQGVRPANHPRLRLRQYARWVEHRPDWPERLRKLADALTIGMSARTTRDFRRLAGLSRLRDRWRDELVAGSLGGSRLDTLICDGVLPLSGAEVAGDLQACWLHWFPGDLPPGLRAGLRQLGYGDGRMLPFANGVAQGLLGWLLAREPTR